LVKETWNKRDMAALMYLSISTLYLFSMKLGKRDMKLGKRDME